MTFRLAIAQVNGAPPDPEASRAASVRHARQAFGQGARLVVLPELIVPGYVLEEDVLAAAAEPVDGPTVSAWRALAAEHDGWIAGGFCEREGDALYNSAVLVGPDGIALHYRKLHLFDREKRLFSPGNLGLPVARTPLGVLGLCVCYDLRFVEVARALALRGAEIIVVPTAWVAGFDSLQWDQEGYCPQARGVVTQANLDQVFIACASQAGRAGEVDFLGSSLVVDPRGSTVLGPLPGTEQAIACVDIDASESQRAQRRSELITPRADRRTDVYGVWLEGTTL